MRAPYSVTITQVDDRGLLVQVGCKTLAYPIRDLEHFMADLALYITDPEHAIKAMSERHGWATGEVHEPIGAGLVELQETELTIPVTRHSLTTSPGRATAYCMDDEGRGIDPSR